MAEGGGLLNRYTLVKAYRGFESHPLRHLPSTKSLKRLDVSAGIRCGCAIWRTIRRKTGLDFAGWGRPGAVSRSAFAVQQAGLARVLLHRRIRRKPGMA